jgi:hypothetical protein
VSIHFLLEITAANLAIWLHFFHLNRVVRNSQTGLLFLLVYEWLLFDVLVPCGVQSRGCRGRITGVSSQALRWVASTPRWRYDVLFLFYLFRTKQQNILKEVHIRTVGHAITMELVLPIPHGISSSMSLL